ncbi:butyryl-CoA dehydrogenase [Sporosarcina sp. NCCP-2222]|uniref:acyl-CoA dehydrogenase family protein n=1 Tax=Sporosarcina sp. NCCP-2222 TaxID=2935073 RepID=UPI00208D381F|nr:acyl-CoA dehydrogenase family protein [Sporosarcina sp. NCCP-2222]GKV55810.1 butyryl-CoA dehydrogenase [Sporosarcina sp. NCCP-2222]
MKKELFMKSDLQREWVAKLAELKASIQGEAVENDRLSRFPRKTIQTLVDMGYTKLGLPKEYGGSGMTVSDMIMLQETLASYDGATALSIGWHQGVVGDLYEHRAWKQNLLDQFSIDVQNGALVNRAVSEAQTGSPTRGGRPQTIAISVDGGWEITGRKTFTSMSPVLTHLLVTAWVEEKNGVGTFLIKRSAAGISFDPTWDMVGMRSTESHDLVLEQVYVGDEQLVEFNTAPRTEKLNGWLLHIPACYLGIAQAARDYAVHFAAHYSPNSIQGTIATLPNVQAAIGQMELELIKARHILYSTAEAYDDHSRRAYMQQELGVAKVAVTNSAISIVDQAMRIVGAKSLEMSCPLQRYYRDVRAGLHNPPMDDMVISKLANLAIKEAERK